MTFLGGYASELVRWGCNFVIVKQRERMNLVKTVITLHNALDMALWRREKITAKGIRKISITALIDTGAYMMIIPEKIRLQLGLAIVGHELAELANGVQKKAAIAEPVEIHFENRKATLDVLVMGNEVVLGAIPMRAMDVFIHPDWQKLIVNPEHPTRAVFRI